MNPLIRKLAVSTIALTLTGSVGFAQDHPQDQHGQDQHQQDQHQQDEHNRDQQEHSHYVRHDDWRKGGHINHDDWSRGQEVDWRAHHLRQPPRGYEWREVDGNYVLAAITTGLIASVIIAASSPR